MIGGLLSAHVAGVGAAVVSGVGVHDFAVETRIGNAEAIAAADHGSGVDDGNDEVFGVFATAEEGKNAVVGVVGVDPFETVPVELDLMERGLGSIEMIEIADEALDAAVGIVLEEMPIEAVSFAPFVALGKLLAHEEELLAGMRVLISVEQTEVGELLPHVAGHFVEQRVFAMDDFVVGKGKQKVFGEGIEQGESEFVVFVFAMNGIVRKII